jgi:hypothetical protein
VGAPRAGRASGSRPKPLPLWLSGRRRPWFVAALLGVAGWARLRLTVPRAWRPRWSRRLNRIRLLRGCGGECQPSAWHSRPLTHLAGSPQTAPYFFLRLLAACLARLVGSSAGAAVLGLRAGAHLLLAFLGIYALRVSGRRPPAASPTSDDPTDAGGMSAGRPRPRPAVSASECAPGQ